MIQSANEELPFNASKFARRSMSSGFTGSNIIMASVIVAAVRPAPKRLSALLTLIKSYRCGSEFKDVGSATDVPCVERITFHVKG